MGPGIAPSAADNMPPQVIYPQRRRPRSNRATHESVVQCARSKSEKFVRCFEKASLVAKLKAAREHKRAAGGRGSGRFPYAMKYLRRGGPECR